MQLAHQVPPTGVFINATSNYCYFEQIFIKPFYHNHCKISHNLVINVSTHKLLLHELYALYFDTMRFRC